MKKLLAAIIVFMCYIAVPAWGGYDAEHFYNLGLESTMANTKINYFTRAIELNPALSAAYEKRGMLYYFQEHYTETIRNFLKVTKLNPDNANGYAMLGVAYFKKNDYDSALSNLTRAIELKPELAEPYGYRAETYRLKAMLNLAVQDATRAIEIGGNKRTIGKAYSTRAKAYRELGENERAEVDLKKAVNLDPVYDIYKTFTTTEYLADSAGRSASVKSVGRMGAAGLIAIFFVMIFKLTLPPPRKGDEDNDS
ncbi:MAG: tetratricopeptide repeat protein [Deltaproteobacteria bacterium]|nr:tetratricopeptide repeat protein [Deltaproteobacteria bacterium]MBW1970191.1 tetratricopeptide repeat protein [Deltaproteobacteria bacterium]MBW2325974.1 tetratricopeptide repeat protein [Deltaproteobacteria bacterium]